MTETSVNLNSASRWAIRLPISQASSLGVLRLVPGIDVLADQPHVWARGETLPADLLRRIRTIPDAELFARQGGDQLSLWGATVPSERLPGGSWKALGKWLELEFPRAGFAGRVTSKLALSLTRTAAMATANAIATTWPVWMEYAITAPMVRLNRWSFAVSRVQHGLCTKRDQIPDHMHPSELTATPDKGSTPFLSNADRQVLILGTPLPPLSGQTLVEESRVIVPSGWRFEPDLGHRAIAQVLNLTHSEYAVFDQDGSYTRIARSSFVKATRSAVRASNG